MTAKKTPGQQPQPEGALVERPPIEDVRSSQERAGLAADFDAYISKLQARDTTQHEHLHEALKEVGQQLTPYVETLLGRPVQKLDTLTGVGLYLGEFANGAAVFFVDTVVEGSLRLTPLTPEGEVIPLTAAEKKGTLYAAERGRMVAVVGRAKYQLDPTRGYARAVLIFQ
jgi:hypothetical protein